MIATNANKRRFWTKVPWCVLGLMVGTACKDKQQEASPAAPAAAASLSGPSGSERATHAPSPASAGSCPEGRWKYDYSDQALEVMMKNAAGAKVLKEEGEFICAVSSGQAGAITCDTQGKPVINVVEAKQMGLAMTISIELNGSATTKFTLLDGGRMKVVSSDVSQLKIKANVKLAGKDIPFPTEQLFTMFGNPESVIAYKCDDGKLHIKPELANVDSTWQELTRAN